MEVPKVPPDPVPTTILSFDANTDPMDTADTYFPYSEYRPGQRHMLEIAARVAREGGIAMIDAPTGSGKSSVVASLLAERKGRKIVIAVRTVSQLTTFVRELELVRRKKPSDQGGLPRRQGEHVSPWRRRGCIPAVRGSEGIFQFTYA